MGSNTNSTHPIKLVFLQHTKVPRKGAVTPVSSHPLRPPFLLFCPSLHCVPLSRRAAPFPKVTTSKPSLPKVLPGQDCVADLHTTAHKRKPQSWMRVPFLKLLWPTWAWKTLFDSFLSSCLISSSLTVKTLLFPAANSYLFHLLSSVFFPLSHPVWSSQMVLFPGKMTHWDICVS